MKKETPEDFEEVLLSIQQSIQFPHCMHVRKLPKARKKPCKRIKESITFIWGQEQCLFPPEWDNRIHEAFEYTKKSYVSNGR